MPLAAFFFYKEWSWATKKRYFGRMEIWLGFGRLSRGVIGFVSRGFGLLYGSFAASLGH